MNVDRSSLIRLRGDLHLLGDTVVRWEFDQYGLDARYQYTRVTVIVPDIFGR